MARDIASAAWVAVLKPRPAHFGVLLVDDEVVVGEVKSQGTNHVQAAQAGPNADDSYLLRRAQWLLPHVVACQGFGITGLGVGCASPLSYSVGLNGMSYGNHLSEGLEGGA